jgi:hypothetical protein
MTRQLHHSTALMCAHLCALTLASAQISQDSTASTSVLRPVARQCMAPFAAGGAGADRAHPLNPTLGFDLR